MNGFRGLGLYLFLSGTAALFISPFLTWFHYGLNLMFPSDVSLIYLFEMKVAGATSVLVLVQSPLLFYLTGGAAAIIVAAVARRPLFFLGILPALVPTLIVFDVVSSSIEYNYPGYLQVLTLGVFTAFLGSALLEASYFSYREKVKRKLTAALTIPNNAVASNARWLIRMSSSLRYL
jgi:hypothetical protein